MSIETTLPIDNDSVVNQSKLRKEPEWMTDFRLQSAELARSLELPKLEKTRIHQWDLPAYGALKAASDSSISRLSESTKTWLQTDGEDQNVVIQHNAQTVQSHLSKRLAEQGVIFTDMLTALQEHEDIVKKYFMKAVSNTEHRLSAQHGALWNNGIFIYVPRNVQVELPLQGMFVTDDAESAFTPHVLLIAEEQSSVTYVDNYVSQEGEGNQICNAAVEVFVKPGAQVVFASTHQLASTVTDISYRRAIVEKDGRMEWIVGDLNNGYGVSDTTSLLNGDGSNSSAKIICIGGGEQNLNVTTRAIHFGKHSDSSMITRAVMKEEATAIINGITKIEKGATGADGQQTEKVLMLSRKARGDANPILLIDEDDVTAGHAASVGRVNKEQVHYLMSRGITKQTAERLIINGFLAPVIEEIPIEQVVQQLKALVERKLEQ